MKDEIDGKGERKTEKERQSWEREDREEKRGLPRASQGSAVGVQATRLGCACLCRGRAGTGGRGSGEAQLRRHRAAEMELVRHREAEQTRRQARAGEGRRAKRQAWSQGKKRKTQKAPTPKQVSKSLKKPSLKYKSIVSKNPQAKTTKSKFRKAPGASYAVTFYAPAPSPCLPARRRLLVQSGLSPPEGSSPPGKVSSPLPVHVRCCQAESFPRQGFSYSPPARAHVQALPHLPLASIVEA